LLFGEIDTMNRLSPFLAVPLLLTGCLFPALLGTPDVNGRPLEPADVEFLTDPDTTRKDVIEALGSPDWLLKEERVLVYVWEKTYYLRVSSMGPDDDTMWPPYERTMDEVARIPIYRRWALLVVLDETDHIQRFTIHLLDRKQTVEENARKWWRQSSAK